MNNLKLKNIDKTLFRNNAYKYLNRSIFMVYALFMLVYMFRGNLLGINNPYITLFAWTAPNLFPSFLFTLIGIFYVVPILSKGTKAINNPKILWIINGLNIIVFALIEYLHVVLNLGGWDHLDMFASLMGMTIATSIYFKVRKYYIK